MKKKTIFKIVLMFIILASMLLIHNTVNATIPEPDANDVYTFYFNDVLKEMKIFCVQKNIWLPESKELKYKKDGAPIKLNGDSPNQAVRAWAYLLASNQNKTYNTGDWKFLVNNPLQNAIWKAIGDENNFIDVMKAVEKGNFVTDSWESSDNELLQEAYQYSKIYNEETKSTELQGENITINAPIGGCIVQNYKSNQVYIKGPFTIENCNYSIFKNEIKAGVTKLELWANSEGDLNYKIFYYENDVLTEVDNYKKFNEIMKTGFYIGFTEYPTVASANLKITYKSINIPEEVEIQPLKSAMTDTDSGYTTRWFCDAHKGSEKYYFDGEGGSPYVFTGSGTNNYPTRPVEGLAGPYIDTASNRKYYIDKYNINEKTETITETITTYQCPECDFVYSTLGEAHRCHGKNPIEHNNTTTSEKTYYTADFNRYTELICTNTSDKQIPVYNSKTAKIEYLHKQCGAASEYSIDYSGTQKLAYITSRFDTKEKYAQTKFDITPMFREITLYKTNILNGNLVKNAQFSGTISNIKSFYLDEKRTQKVDVNNNVYTFNNLKLANGKNTIYYVELADMNEPVVIKLTETKVPDGYVGMDGEVTITLNYLEKTKTITYGNQVTIEDITVDENKLQQYVVEIKAKNDPKPEARIQLAKVDSDNNYAPIQGVKFNGTIENAIKPFTAEKMQKFSLTTDRNGIITTDEFMIDDITKNVVITLTEVEIPEQEGFRYKWLDPNGITIKLRYVEKDDGTGKLVLDNWTYGGEEAVSVDPKNINIYSDTDSKIISLYLTVPNERLIDITGQVWLDGDTILNNKTNGTVNGIKDSYENGMGNVLVYLYNSSNQVVRTTVTNNNGDYNFEDIDFDANGYYVVFEYDGVNYEETTKISDTSNTTTTSIISMAEENNRTDFNNKFITITGGTVNTDKSETTGTAISKDRKTSTELTYYTIEGINGYNDKSILQTTGERTVNDTSYTNVVKENFAMTASSEKTVFSREINYGLVKRGIDLRLETNCLEARVTINDKEHIYPYEQYKDETIEIGDKETFDDNVKYVTKLNEPDYNYRIRDYVSDDEMKHVDNTGTIGQKTGEELKVYVTYRLSLKSQCIDTGYIETVKYTHDSRYKFMSALTNLANQGGITNYKINENGNVMTISFNELELTGGETKELYLVFEADIDDLKDEFTNTAEIISYKTDDGLIDIDSAPGNYYERQGIKEDDSDKSRGLKFEVISNNPRTITGYVFDKDNNEKINGVIVQLIELKQLENADGEKQYYEYIWQETVSGYKGGKRMMVRPDAEGHLLEDMGLEKGNDGEFTFEGYIPGNYIIRYIYGDGSTYSYMTSQSATGQLTLYDNIHNGQDYKSVVDKGYMALTYNKDLYSEGDSVARDNEARRLETMAYAVNVDAEKGLLLKLLDNITIDDLNEVEIKTLAGIEPKTTIGDARRLSAGEKEALNSKISTLKTQVLNATWMCAETSTVEVDIDNDAKRSYTDMNLGLEKRPETRISLQKTITSFKLTASNGQTIIDAYWDESKNEIAGISDGLQAIPGTSWKYSVSPTELNTIIDGAKLEFAYDVILKNEGEAYLGSALTDVYNNNSIETYINALAYSKDIVKANVKANGYNSIIGTYLGKKYYDPKSVAKPAPEAKAEVTKIYDYINNDLDIVEGTELKLKDTTVDHYKLADNYSLQNITIKRVLENKNSSGKLAKDEVVKYKVILGRDPISSTGTLDFTNYIAEVMSFTNAQGRRSVATPGNAWAVDERKLDNDKDGVFERIVEIDECAADKIQLGEAYGEDKETSFIWLAIGAVVVAILGAGAFVTKKYIIK